jgi:hypothetical protein
VSFDPPCASHDSFHSCVICFWQSHMMYHHHTYVESQCTHGSTTAWQERNAAKRLKASLYVGNQGCRVWPHKRFVHLSSGKKGMSLTLALRSHWYPFNGRTDSISHFLQELDGNYPGKVPLRTIYMVHAAWRRVLMLWVECQQKVGSPRVHFFDLRLGLYEILVSL